MFSKLLLLVVALIGMTYGFSSGQVDLCNALSTKFGCDDFKDGARNMCQEENQIMDWVTKPKENTAAFNMFAGDEASPKTTYKPGEWIQISIRAKTYGLQYRGLLMYAIDHATLPEGYPNHKSGDPAKIGQWEFTDRETMFHSHCPRTVLHTAGQLKPYLTTFRFQAPTNFDGEIAFVALIKTGPANMGEFWFPNKLVLTKEVVPEQTVQEEALGKWYRGAADESCTEVCAKEQMLCDESRLNEITSAADLESKVAPAQACMLPYLLRCSALGLTSGDDNSCYYSSQQQCTAAGTKADETPTCDAKSPDTQVGHRLCRCKCDGTKGPCTPPTTTTTTTTTTTVAATTTTAPGAPPRCTRDFGCDCAADGSCVAKATCSSGKCIRKSTCVYGEAGCPCELQSNTCAQHLTCDGGVCAAKAVTGGGVDFCANKIGTAGCWCTEAGGCVSGELEPRKNADGRCYCAVTVDAGDVSQICVRGELGCACDRQRCDQGVCQLVGRNTICLQDDGASPASSLSLALSMCALALVGLLF